MHTQMNSLYTELQRRLVSPRVAFTGLILLSLTLLCSGQQTTGTGVRLDIPHSDNPFAAYSPSRVPEPNLANSARIDQLIRDGKLYLSLRDALLLALENNLDISIARYNMAIAETDIERTRAGGIFRGVNTGIVQNTPGGGVGGLGAGAPGAGAGGTTSGAGGAGSGAAGLVQSTLGTGTTVSSYDPAISGTFSVEHYTEPLSNLQVYGVPSLQTNTTTANIEYTQAFPSGTSLSFTLDNGRQTGNSTYNYLNPSLNAYYRFDVQQQLLAGFGLGPNLRYLHIAKNDQKISDAAFKDQVITTITQIENIYWDLVQTYQDEQVKERSLKFAEEAVASDKKQLALEAIPAIDVTKAEAEVANRDQDLTIARTNLQLQESLLKNALTKNLDDPTLEEIPVVPTEQIQVNMTAANHPLEALIAEALNNRPELKMSLIDLQNRNISRRAADNALLPTVTLNAYYGGTGLAGPANPLSEESSSVPTTYWGSLGRAFGNSSPDYYVGLQVNIPLRNRLAKSDQYRSELEYRQSELSIQQLKKQIRIEVRNAQYALQQSVARVDASRTSRDLAQQSFDVAKKEQKLGAGSNLQTLVAQRDLALAESAFATALAVYEKAEVELARATGTTLDVNDISIQDAETGKVASTD